MGMTNLRKALPYLLLACAALMALPLAAQPDCSFTFTFTGASTQTAVSNLSQNTPCVNWRLTLSTTGTLSATVTFYTSPDNITFTAVPNTVCSSTVQPPCVLQGANPIVGTQGMLYVTAYGSYVQVVVTSPSGAGTGTVRGYGAKGASASGGGSGGGGGAGTVTNVATASPITGGPITGSGTIGLDTTLVAQKFFGTGAPGSVAGNLPGDLFTNTAGQEYVCGAASGTAAPACTSVTAGGWLLVNGGGSSITQGVFASLPAPGTAGSMYQCTNCPYVFISTGAAWNAYLGSQLAVLPSLTTFTWVNQLSATVDASRGNIFLLSDLASGNNAHLQVTAAAGSHFTFRVAMNLLLNGPASQYPAGGIVMRESATGKFVVFGVNTYTTYQLCFTPYPNPTTSGSVTPFAAWGLLAGAPYVFFKGVYNGTSIIFSYSLSGDIDAQYITISTTAVGSSFTTAPDQVGFVIDNGGAAIVHAVNILSFTQSTP